MLFIVKDLLLMLKSLVSERASISAFAPTTHESYGYKIEGPPELPVLIVQYKLKHANVRSRRKANDHDKTKSIPKRNYAEEAQINELYKITIQDLIAFLLGNENEIDRVVENSTTPTITDGVLLPVKQEVCDDDNFTEVRSVRTDILGEPSSLSVWNTPSLTSRSPFQRPDDQFSPPSILPDKTSNLTATSDIASDCENKDKVISEAADADLHSMQKRLKVYPLVKSELPNFSCHLEVAHGNTEMIPHLSEAVKPNELDIQEPSDDSQHSVTSAVCTSSLEKASGWRIEQNDCTSTDGVALQERKLLRSSKQQDRTVGLQTVASKETGMQMGETGQQQVHAGEKLYSCTHCGKKYANMSQCQIHESFHKVMKNSSFSDCDNGSANPSITEEAVNGKKSHTCAHCNKTFVRRSVLLIHERIHTGQKPFSCAYCNKAFTQKTQCVEHEKIHTGEKSHSCTHCGKKFSRRTDCVKHERIHTGEKLFSCVHCSKKFAELFKCRIHERTHTGERPFVCSYCDKKFADARNLGVHERIHTGEKRYSCMYCGKKFTQKSTCTQHQRTHIGEEHMCTLCGKKFADKDQLAQHVTVHLWEKRYCCSYCDKSFAQKGSCTQHERVHTGEEPFSCRHCNEKFKYHQSWKRHEMLHATQETVSAGGDANRVEQTLL